MYEKELIKTIQDNHPASRSSDVEEMLRPRDKKKAGNFILNKGGLTKVAAKILFVMFFLLGSQNVNSQTVFPSNVKNLCPFDSSDFVNSMTKINLPVLGSIGPFYDKQSGLVYVFPPDGPGFNPKAPDCDFFKWAAQMFLWTTSTVSDTSSVPKKPALPSRSTPYVFNSEFFYRYSGSTLTPQSADGSNVQNMPSFLLRTVKPQHADGVGQAGGNGVLISQGNNKVSKEKSVVYYGVHTNRVLGYVAAANLAASNTYTQFPSDGSSVCSAIHYGLHNGYADSTLISNTLYGLFCSQYHSDTKTMADATGVGGKSSIGIPSLETAIDYLSMVVELKTSWVEASSLVDKNKYILQTAKIPTYSKTDSVWVNTGVQTKELALVGMHVVGTVNGHPEMIWATIEHINNAPNADYYYINSKGDTVKHSTVYNKPNSIGKNSNWLFANGTDTLQNYETAVVRNDTIFAKKHGVDIEPTNTVKTNPWGVKHSDKSGAKISSELIAINNNVFGALKRYNKKNKISNDPRENYFVSGANWGSGGAVPTSFTATGAGSPYLENNTMETFVQKDNGCFGCHSAESSNQSMTTSHIFGKIKNIVKLKQ